MIKLILLVSILGIITACDLLPGKKDSGRALARVYDRYLYADETEDLVPAGTTSKDSIQITRNYINNWIRQELLLHMAKSNLTDEQIDFEKQVEQYRNSLIIFQYESELVRQKLDTTISMQEIEAYYKKNQSNFLLHENILRSVYVVLPGNSTYTQRFRQLIRSSRESGIEKLAELAQQHASSFHLDDQQWLAFNDFVRNIPVTVSDQLGFLQSNPYFEVQDSASRYLVKILDYKIKESVSPLSFEAANVRAILLNKRKSELLTRMEEDLYSNARKKKNIETYQ